MTGFAWFGPTLGRELFEPTGPYLDWKPHR